MAVSIERIDGRHLPVSTCDECGSRTVVDLDPAWDPEHVADHIDMLLESQHRRFEEWQADPDDAELWRAFQHTALNVFVVLMGYRDERAEDLAGFRLWKLAEIETERTAR